MAKEQKIDTPPNEDKKEITVPKALTPIIQAFHVDSEESVKTLLMEAAQAIYGNESSAFNNRVSEFELEGVAHLMKSIKPRDSLETLYAAQIVVSHMLGMRKLAQTYLEDQKLGLNLLRFCNQAMQNLDKKRRSGGEQNITVNYNYNDQRNTPI